METTRSILWVSHSGRDDGGAELSLYSLVETAQELGFRQHVVIPAAGGLEKKLAKLGVEYTIIPFSWWTIGGPRDWADLKNDALATGRLYALIRELDPDVVITNTMVHPWAALASAKAKVPHVWMVREFGSIDMGLKFILGQRATYRFIDKYSSLVVTNSQAIKTHLLKYIEKPENIIVSYPFVTIPKFSRKSSGQDKSRVELVMLGNVRESKGQLETAKALCLLPPSMQSNVRLTLVGPYQDAEKQKIENYIKNHDQANVLVEFAGPRSDPFKFLLKSDIFIMASKNEAFGRATVEAMAVGLPVIGTKSGGTPEVVIDGKTGILYEPGDLDALSKAIVQLAGDSQQRTQIGKNGQQRVREVFSKDAARESFFSNLATVNTYRHKIKYRYIYIVIISLLALAFLARFPYRFIKSLVKPSRV